MVPHDILRVSGEEAVQQYLLHEIQQVYQSQKVEINDKHCEIIIARMLRKVKIESAGDTNLLPGLVMDRFQFRRANEELAELLESIESWRQRLHRRDDHPQGSVRANQRPDRSSQWYACQRSSKPKSATASTQLLGITKAAVQSNSFISAASFQETTKVLTEAALAGKVDKLVGLKENVILGHLIPAGTGFRIFQESEVNYRREALEELASAPVHSLEESFPLLNASDEGGSSAAGTVVTPARSMDEQPSAAAEDTQPSVESNEALDSMFGGGQD